MGWCHEFGCRIVSGCDHPMVAGEAACTCAVCEVVCTGKFGGCADVWARGPQSVRIVHLPEVPLQPEPQPDVATAVATLEPVAAAEPMNEETPDVREEEVPAAVTNPAAEIVTWLKGEFDGVHNRIQALSDRVARQEAAVRVMTESRAEELGVSLAELEGCAGRLRHEAASLAEMRSTLADSIPQLASEAVAPALAETAARAVAEVRSTIAELGAALAETLLPAITQAAAVPLPSVAAPATDAPAEPGHADADGAEGADTDLVTQLHEAQDEAAEWFTIVVDEAVRRAVERHLVPTATPPAPGDGGPSAASTPVAPVTPVATSGPVGDGPPAPQGASAGTADAASVFAPSDGPSAGGASAAPVTEGLPTTPDDTGGDRPDGGSTAAEAGMEAQPVARHGGEGPARSRPVPSPEGPRIGVLISDRDADGPGQTPSHGPVETIVADLGLAPAPVAPGPPPPVTAAPSANGSPTAAETRRQGVDAWDDDGEEAPERESSVACVLPGVAVGPTLALGVSSALRRARLRRRRRRPAGAPAAGLHRHDPFAGALSLRLERFALARQTLAFGADDANGEAAGPAAATVVAAELDDREVAVDLAEGPVSLVGPGAADAGRALVTTFLVRSEPEAGSVLAVGDALPAGPDFPGLERQDDLASALEVLEAELDRRQGSAAGGGAAAPSTPEAPNGDRQNGGGGTNVPLLLLVTTSVPDDLSARLERLLVRGSELGLTALGVGCELAGAATVTLQPGGVTRSVSPEGRAHDLWGSRLFTLSAGATVELLDVLSASRTDAPRAESAEVEDQPFPVLSPAGAARIQVRLLGGYRLEVDGKEIKSGLRAKARELLAFYLLHTEGTTLDVATEALWPEADAGRGSEWFWTALGNLRTTLRRAAGTKSLMIIERDGDRYRIEPVFDVDVWRFQAALPSSAVVDAGDPAWPAALETAAGLYGGELLGDVDWAWVDVPREDLRRRAVDVLVALAAIRQRAGDVRAALDTLSRAVEVDPLAEQIYRRIMRLQANQAGPEEVAATFRRLRARLEDLALEPTPESIRLAAELCGTT